MKPRFIFSLFVTLAACTSAPPPQQPGKPFAADRLELEVAGENPIVLKKERNPNLNRPQIIEVQILPSRGMNIFQIKAYVPYRGLVSILSSPTIEDAAKMFSEADVEADRAGKLSFREGGAILVPFAGVIRGTPRTRGNHIETTIDGQKLELPTGGTGQGQPRAMNGLILKSEAKEIKLESSFERASGTGVIDAGDFDGHWLSDSLLTITANLTDTSFGFTVIAKNQGKEPLPIGIGWNPHFGIAAERREKATLKIPATQRALVNNELENFPTGQLVQTAKSAYDFTLGAPLKNLRLDDEFFGIQKSSGNSAVAELIDPGAGYGVRLTALSPEVKVFRVQAPADKNFVSITPQFNLSDPYNKAWGETPTGMVRLQPGESVTYAVELELFTPAGAKPQ